MDRRGRRDKKFIDWINKKDGISPHRSVGSWIGRGKKKKDLQKSKRDIALQSSLQLELDIQVQAKLETDGLGVGQTGKGLRAGETALLLEGALVSAAATAAGVDGGAVSVIVVVELFWFFFNIQVRSSLPLFWFLSYY